MQNIRDLISYVYEACHSEENQKKVNNKSNVKLIVGIGRPVFADVLGFSMLDYYKNPEVCLESQLKWKLFCHNEIKDDTPIDLLAGLDYSNALEPTFFGVESIFSEKKDPTYKHAIINEPEDLDNLQLPDFYKSGLMPDVHRFYENMNDLAGDKLKIFFPGWARGPWSIGTILRGFNEILIDTKESPEFVHKLMQFTVDARIHFEEERCKFLKINPTDKSYLWKYVTYRSNTSSDLFEDEVDGGVFSKETFSEFIVPYVKKLGEFYNGISYYHSCGNLTPFLPDLALSNIESVIHISPWTDMKKAVEIMPESITLQKSLHPFNDVAEADEEWMKKNLSNIIEEAKGHKLEIWADGLYSGSWNTVNKAKKLVEIFREITG